MAENERLELYEDQSIRTAWNEKEEEWYFSVVDVVGVLTDQPDVRHASTYWAVLKKRMLAEGAYQLLTSCKQLKLKASDGKHRLTDVATTEQLLRIIQSIPSNVSGLIAMFHQDKHKDFRTEILFCFWGCIIFLFVLKSYY